MKKHITLVGVDGNVFSVMGFVTRHMKQAGFDKEEVDAYQASCMSADYDHALRQSMRMVDQINAANGVLLDDGDDIEGGQAIYAD